MNRMTTDTYFDLRDKDNDTNTDEIGIKYLCKIHSNHLFLFQIYFKVTENYQVSPKESDAPLMRPCLEGSCALALTA